MPAGNRNEIGVRARCDKQYLCEVTFKKKTFKT
jgi:hypothetical protein